MKKKYATLEDVARAAGMSRAQVSRALRGDPGVKPETRDHVQAVAKQLSYRPNVAARNLVQAQSTTVGLLIGEPLNPFHVELAQAIDRALALASLDTIVSLRSVTDDATLAEAERMIELRAAAAILIATPRDPEMVRSTASRLPCVYIGKDVGVKDMAVVEIDDEAGVKQAIRHLIALGHRHIAHIGGQTEVQTLERREAYRETMLEAGLEPNVWIGSHDVDSGRRGVDVLMAGAKQPTAIFAANDAIAIGAMDRLKALGLQVPEDVSVIGFDDIPVAGTETFSLTTVRQDTDALALAVVQAIQSIAFNRPHRDELAGEMPQRKWVLPVSLVVRRSVGPAKR